VFPVEAKEPEPADRGADLRTLQTNLAAENIIPAQNQKFSATASPQILHIAPLLSRDIALRSDNLGELALLSSGNGGFAFPLNPPYALFEKIAVRPEPDEPQQVR
jgi:hypothetical protein